MANVADFQNTMGNPLGYAVGVPTVILLDGYTQAAVATVDINVGAAVFITDITQFNQSAAASGTAVQFAGIALRSNTSGLPWGSVPAGFANVIAAKANVQIMTRGSVPINIAVANESGSVPLKDSIVYAKLSDGTWQTQTVGGSAPSGCVATNFRVKQIYSGWTAGGPVEVTNIQNVGA